MDSKDSLEKALQEHLGVTPRRARSWGRNLVHFAKLGALMVVSAIVIPVAMISLGLLFGPKGYEGVLLAPLSVLGCWAVILFLGLRRPETAQRLSRARLAELPGRALAFAEQHRKALPHPAHAPLESILLQLEELEAGLVQAPDDAPSANKLRRLLAEDLPDLIEHYKRLPPRLRQKSLHGGETPEEQVVAGLVTIDAELHRAQEELAQADIFSLAIKQRYLEMKYGKGSAR